MYILRIDLFVFYFFNEKGYKNEIKIKYDIFLLWKVGKKYLK